MHIVRGRIYKHIFKNIVPELITGETCSSSNESDLVLNRLLNFAVKSFANIVMLYTKKDKKIINLLNLRFSSLSFFLFINKLFVLK